MCADIRESELKERFLPFEGKMADEGIPHLVIDQFRRYYEDLVRGEKGLLSRRDIASIEEADIADMKALEGFTEQGSHAIKESVVIKLNGGLGTSMGLSKAKSLIEVKDGLCFLDIIARQTMTYRDTFGVELPLVLMNSFKTDEDSRHYLARYTDLVSTDIPLSFLQHKFPKVLTEDLSPCYWPRDPDCEWNPPGHGDIYLALITSGMLDALIDKGYTYAFISNSDNLGAIMDEALLGYFASHDHPFMIEVADRTDADRKGGHLARVRKTGGLVLREIAQCPEEELDEFQDITLYRFFNTNNIWINLISIKDRLKGGIEGFTLPMIVNPKRIDPTDDTSPEVYQIETAMGSAISIFQNAAAIKVPRTRFSPVKKSQDLLALWSDCYVMTADSRIILNPARRFGPLRIDLDDAYYKRIDQLQERFAHGAPSLVACKSLSIKGNVYFGRGIVVKGEVCIVNHSTRKAYIPDGTMITKDLIYR
ncbi:MAG: UTP--glucose-1-phosphate uridylyltransferase [Deltaproteobacteria bacterium]|nr:MAG: UTP--glucose-1-phosphate uridylyltransferase [Deltaproteobacteria bacterium]